MQRLAVFVMNHMRESIVSNSHNVAIMCVWIVKEIWKLLQLLHVVHYVTVRNSCTVFGIRRDGRATSQGLLINTRIQTTHVISHIRIFAFTQPFSYIYQNVQRMGILFTKNKNYFVLLNQHLIHNMNKIV